ncbi:hypothetical protein LCGC14_0412540 [marine sediment metagenome]|uniref:Uncharacterized protein n=1 Tax=marine sediment metagenome TaxID=412755 RepID=A0A0F9W2P5_9ZZZZ
MESVLDSWQAGLITDRECTDSLECLKVRGAIESDPTTGRKYFLGYDYDAQEWIDTRLTV